MQDIANNASDKTPRYMGKETRKYTIVDDRRQRIIAWYVEL
jgi:hypothetical protein